MRKTRPNPKSQNSWAERAVSLGGEVHDETDGATYRVVRFLGRGGMGEVYEVVRVDTGDHFALKCRHVRPERSANKDRSHRSLRGIDIRAKRLRDMSPWRSAYTHSPDEKWRSSMKHLCLLPLAFVAAIGMTSCAAAVDEPTDEAVETAEAAEPLQEAANSSCIGVWITFRGVLICAGIELEN